MKHVSLAAPLRRLCAVLAVLLAAAVLCPAALAAYELPVTLANEEESVYLYNMDNDTVLLDYNSTEVRYVASTTKMMTALLLIESGQDLETVVTIPTCLTQEFKDIQATNGTDMNLKIGEEIRLKDLLYGLIVRSANDAASVIAWYLGGQAASYDAAPFVVMMNARAAELGCTGTTFGCPHGLYDHGNVSTAQDLARIAEACYASELYMQVATTLTYTLPVTNKHPYERDIENVNFMMQPDYEYYRDYIRGMKTGFTTLAGRCYVTTATQNGDTYLLVVLGSTKESIYAECSGILDWAFASFSNRVLLDMETQVAALPLNGCAQAEEIPLYAARSVAAYGLNSDEVSLSVDLPEKVNAPVKAGKVLGTVTVSLGGTVIDTVELVAAQDYESAFLTGLWNTVLLAPVLVVILVALALFTVKVGGGDARALAGEMAETVQNTVKAAQTAAEQPKQRQRKPARRKAKLPLGGKRGQKQPAGDAAGAAAPAPAGAEPVTAAAAGGVAPTGADAAPAGAGEPLGAEAAATRGVFDFDQAPVSEMPEEFGFAPEDGADDPAAEDTAAKEPATL